MGLKEKIQKKKQGKKYTVYIFGILIGILMGIFLPSPTFMTIKEILYTLLLLVLGWQAAVHLHMVIQAVGQLLFGLLTGYRFSSFWIGPFMWVRINGQLKRKRTPVSGVISLCSMNPPKQLDKQPFALHLLGGSITNLIFSLIFFILGLTLDNNIYLSAFLLMLGIVGLIVALLFGIPHQFNGGHNYGYKTLLLFRNPKALLSYVPNMYMHCLLKKTRKKRKRQWPHLKKWHSPIHILVR